MTSERSEAVRVGLVALFVTALVTSQVTASKLLAFSLPFSLPLAGSTLVLPGAALAYALTFFASDCYAELYGRRAATVVVNVGFAMNFVLLALVWSTIFAPGLPQAAQPVDLAAFRNVLGASTAIVVASLSAYLISQNWDVFVFHWLRDQTDGKKLWLRNIGSTATSQLIDTVIFIGVGFVLFQGVPPSEALALIVGQYLLKVAIAVLDTPFVYAVVGFARRNNVVTTPASAD
ncbi:unknown [Haloarcula marismortui ATCC 43049]|uniref:Probable queuosine precursor transporter n=1 Tax=Haloarcula marismortui (strain ATCC 43049 / DSM 3752 / JCM 8966 / VKM B-1809) TaxID=272569 RepID=Q5UYP8_HALMA|nr:queuosine precursor transporter [Haloarcula marismortui]AAV47605.1 unknown [Haloarcula marismortui ATCC 43049]QCP92299.1 VUT family protein [Haloarcula marismortui ATCC 43049]